MLAELKPGVKLVDLCARGDKYIEECARAAAAAARRRALTKPRAMRCARSALRRRPLTRRVSRRAARETAKVFNKAKTKDGAKVDKGSAFPTCVSLNRRVVQRTWRATRARGLHACALRWRCAWPRAGALRARRGSGGAGAWRCRRLHPRTAY